MSERERRNLGEDERGGRELHDVCKVRVRGKTLCIMPSSTTECGKLEPVSGIASGELRST